MKTEIPYTFNDNPQFYTENYFLYLDLFVTYMYSRNKKHKENLAWKMDMIRYGFRPVFIEKKDISRKEVRKNKKRGTK